MITLARSTIGIAALSVACTAAIAQTARENDVFFSINGLQSFTFQESGHCISPGQPYNGLTSGINNGQGKITIEAGRHATPDVAACFKNWVNAGETLVCDATGTYPKDLNFAVIGTMTIGSVDGSTITCDNVIVAQGSFGKNNNWWMGGPNMKGAHVGPSGATEQTCQDTGKHLPSVVVFAPQTPCVNNFSIAVNQPGPRPGP